MFLSVYADLVAAIFFTILLFSMITYFAALSSGKAPKRSEEITQEDVSDIKELVHYIALRCGYVDKPKKIEKEEREEKENDKNI